MAFIVDSYNKYDSFDRVHARKIFEINGNWYAIKKVELEWGKPKFPFYATHDKSQYQYEVYSTYEEAYEFVQHMKFIN